MGQNFQRHHLPKIPEGLAVSSDGGNPRAEDSVSSSADEGDTTWSAHEEPEIT